MRHLITFVFTILVFATNAQDLDLTFLNNKLTVAERADSKITLNGQWQFLASNSIDESELLLGEAIEWDTLNVPGNWDTRARYAEHVGKGYYKREFIVPTHWKGKQIRIQFDAIYHTSKVWLNGTLLGEHFGGYTPIEYNITNMLTYDKPNTLVVMADNTYKIGAWWAWGGISRDVRLISNNELRFVYQHLTAIPNFKTNKVLFVLDYKIENNGAKNRTFNISTEIKSTDNTHLFTKRLKGDIAENSISKFKIEFEKPMSDFKLWDVQNPNLYQAISTLSAKTEHHKITDKFGIRKIEARGEQLYLNNKPLYANGLNRVHDHPAYGNTEPDVLVQSDILDIKSLGATMSRLMHAPLAKNLLNFCDSIGFLLIEEIPVWGDDDVQSFKDNPQAKSWLDELITRDYNHPSVIGWSVGNELRQNDSIAPWGKKALTTDQFEYINSMLDYVEKLDTTRLKTYVGLTTYQAGSNMNNEPFEKLDLICINSYGNALYAAKTTNEKFPGKPIFLSEIGIAQIGPAPEGELSEALINQLTGLREMPFVVGSSLWSYNDYRSNYKGTPASGYREWGVVNQIREPKKAYEQIKKIYTNK